MGYHITLARPKALPGITEQEWRQFVLGRPELTLLPATQDAHFITAILDGQEHLALHFCKGEVFTKNPDGPRIISYMVSIAPHFEAVVTGDEGETFATEADWGTRNQWDQPSPKKSFWRREFTPGNILRMAILLLVAALLIHKHFFID